MGFEPTSNLLLRTCWTQTPWCSATRHIGAQTKQFNDFNDGHVVDIAETGSGDSGEDTCVEVKSLTNATTLRAGD
jgi:hypothetical protein